MFEVGLLAPETVEVGQTFTVAIRTISRGVNPAMWVYVAGFFVGDSAEPIARREDAVAAIMLGYERWSLGIKETGNGFGSISHLPVTAEHPGEIRVRLLMWIIVGPPPVGSLPVEWRDDNSPVIPPGVTWHKRVEVEHITEVIE